MKRSERARAQVGGLGSSEFASALPAKSTRPPSASTNYTQKNKKHRGYQTNCFTPEYKEHPRGWQGVAILSKTIEPPPPIRHVHHTFTRTHSHITFAAQTKLQSPQTTCQAATSTSHHTHAAGPIYNTPSVKRSERARAQVGGLRLERVSRPLCRLNQLDHRRVCQTIHKRTKNIEIGKQTVHT